jgi:S1-C subfamily serine protease
MALRELVSEIRQSVYAVLIEWANPVPGQARLQTLGTAFAVSAEGHFFTADHVINLNHGNPPGPVRGPNDKILLAQMQPDGMTASISGPYQVLSHSQPHDYAILHLQTAPGRTQKYLELDLGPRFEGEEVAVCGYPLASTTIHPTNNSISMNLNLRVAAGIISSQRVENESKILEVDFPIIPGNSGGPLFSVKTGKVVGLASATLSVGGPNGQTIGHVGIARDIRNARIDLRPFL